MRLTSAVVALIVAISTQSALPAQPADPRPPAVTEFSFAVPSGTLRASSVATDSVGNIYVGGYTSWRTQLPSPIPPAVGESWGQFQGFVAKFDPTGKAVWTRYIGGNDARMGGGRSGILSGDYILDIDVDPGGQVSFVGYTFSTDLPVVNAFQHVAQFAGYHDGFVGKLSADGQRYLFLSYFGGPDGFSELTHVVAGQTGETWIAGRSQARQLATHHDLSSRGLGESFVLKLNPAGGVVWSTRLPGSLQAFGVDSLGQPHVSSDGLGKLSVSGSQFLYRLPSLFASDIGFLPDGKVVVSASSSISRVAPWPDSWGRGPGLLAALDDAGRPVTVNQLSTLGGGIFAASQEGTITIVHPTSDPALSTERSIVSFPPEGVMYVSDDAASTWQPLVQPSAATIENLLIDRVQGDLYIEEFLGRQTWRSRDLGETWTRESDRLRFLVFDPFDSRIRWGAGEFAQDLYRRDGEGNLSAVRRWSAANVDALALSPHDGSVWLGSHNSGVETSADGGATWQTYDAGLPFSIVSNRREFDVVSFAFDPNISGLVYAAANARDLGRWTSGVFVKRPNESRWTQLTPDLSEPLPFQRILNVAVNPHNRRFVYAGTTDRGLMRSFDAGQSWHPVLASSVTSIAFDPNRPGLMYAVGNTIYRSLDAGATWSTADTGYRASIAPRRIIVEPRRSRVLVAPQAFAPSLYAMQMGTGGLSGGGDYERHWATYLDGRSTPVDIAASPGASVILLSPGQTADGIRTAFSVVRIGR